MDITTDIMTDITTDIMTDITTLRITTVEAMMKETGVESYKTHSKRLLATTSEKADRLNSDHPKYLAKNPPTQPPHRSKMRSSWRREASKLEASMPSAGAAEQLKNKYPLHSRNHGRTLTLQEKIRGRYTRVYLTLRHSHPVQRYQVNNIMLVEVVCSLLDPVTPLGTMKTLKVTLVIKLQ